MRAHLGPVAAPLHRAPPAAARPRVVIEDESAEFVPAPPEARVGSAPEPDLVEEAHGVARDRRERLTEAQATRPGLAATSAERRRHVGQGGEEVERVDVVGVGRVRRRRRRPRGGRSRRGGRGRHRARGRSPRLLCPRTARRATRRGRRGRAGRSSRREPSAGAGEARLRGRSASPARNPPRYAKSRLERAGVEEPAGVGIGREPLSCCHRTTLAGYPAVSASSPVLQSPNEVSGVGRVFGASMRRTGQLRSPSPERSVASGGCSARACAERVTSFRGACSHRAFRPGDQVRRVVPPRAPTAGEGAPARGSGSARDPAGQTPTHGASSVAMAPSCSRDPDVAELGRDPAPPGTVPGARTGERVGDLVQQHLVDLVVVVAAGEVPRHRDALRRVVAQARRGSWRCRSRSSTRRGRGAASISASAQRRTRSRSATSAPPAHQPTTTNRGGAARSAGTARWTARRRAAGPRRLR